MGFDFRTRKTLSQLQEEQLTEAQQRRYPSPQSFPYEILLNKGIALLSNRKPAEAIEIFDEILNKKPGDMMAFRWKSLANENLIENASKNSIQPIPIKQQPPPIKQQPSPVRQQPVYPHPQSFPYEILLNKGITLLSNRKPVEAIKVFDEILNKKPGDMMAFRWKSLANQNLIENASKNSIQPIPIKQQPPPVRQQPVYYTQQTTLKSQPPLVLSKDNATTILCNIIQDHSISVIDEKKFSGFLNDYFKGTYKRERNILVTSVAVHIPKDLLTKKDQIPIALLSAQLVKRLDDYGFSNELSVWAVRAWILALGIKT